MNFRPLFVVFLVSAGGALISCPGESPGCVRDGDCEGQGACVAGICTEPGPDAGSGGSDGGDPLDAGSGEDGGEALDAGSGSDGGEGLDAGPDGGEAPDAGGVPDGGDAGAAADAGAGDGGPRPDGGPPADSGTYDDTVLADGPAAFWGMRRTGGTEPDLTGNGNVGTYLGGNPALTTLPNGDPVADFNGSSQHLDVPSSPLMSIPTTGNLTWEAWIRPDVLQFPNNSNGYVNWMGKCASYSPTCEWEARMYNTTNPQNRCNRLSAYVFNATAGLGSGADWQPTCGLLQAGRWYHVVGEYTTQSQPAACPNISSYPGSIDIWLNGVKWNQASHNPTGCMGQYSVVPTANGSPLKIGTTAMDSWFQGAIGKVAIYGYRLSQAQITRHYQAMTGLLPSGSCANTCTLQ